MKATVSPQARTLIDYIVSKRKEACAICRLPDAVRAQIKAAREKKIERRIVREWLRSEHKIEIGESEFAAHSNGHHDEQ